MGSSKKPLLSLTTMTSSRFDYRSSSLTSNSSEMSETEEQVSIQTLTECLQRIHRSPEDKTLLEALDLLRLLKRDYLQEMPTSVRSKAVSLTSREDKKASKPQIFHLWADVLTSQSTQRFSASANLKICP